MQTKNQQLTILYCPVDAMPFNSSIITGYN